MSEAFESIMRGLNEALAFARGEKTGAIVHIVEVPDDAGKASGKAKPKLIKSTRKL